MTAHRIKTTVGSDKTLTLDDLPFQSGEQVEVIILSSSQLRKSTSKPYPLRGTQVHYAQPTEPIAQ
jgi:hypothetical protein